MTDITAARERLKNFVWVGNGPVTPGDVRTILDALDAAEEGLSIHRRGVVDLTELAGRFQRERDEAREAAEANHLDGERNYERYEQVLAVIERALENPLRMTAGVQAILESVPADVLRERDAEKWEEGAVDGHRSYGMLRSSLLKRNPYRETKEQD